MRRKKITKKGMYVIFLTVGLILGALLCLGLNPTRGIPSEYIQNFVQDYKTPCTPNGYYFYKDYFNIAKLGEVVKFSIKTDEACPEKLYWEGDYALIAINVTQ